MVSDLNIEIVNLNMMILVLIQSIIALSSFCLRTLGVKICLLDKANQNIPGVTETAGSILCFAIHERGKKVSPGVLL